MHNSYRLSYFKKKLILKHGHIKLFKHLLIYSWINILYIIILYLCIILIRFNISIINNFK